MRHAVLVSRLSVLALGLALVCGPARAAGPADVGTMLDDVDAEVVALRKIDRAQSPWAARYAEVLAGELAQLRITWAGDQQGAGDAQAKQGAKPELYAVGFYEGSMPDGPKKFGIAEVEVRVTDRPVVLALSAYEPIRWKVKIAEGVRVERIFLGGYGDQLLDPPPAGVPVETHVARAGDQQSFYLFPRSGRDGESNTRAEERLRELAGMPVATLQGAYRYGGQPVVVGPADEGWRRQRVVARLEPLWREATAIKRLEGRGAVAGVRFTAIRWDVGNRPMQMAGELTDSTPAGWVEGTGRKLPDRVTQVAADPRGPAWYAIGDRAGPFRLDLVQGTATEMRIKEDIPEMHWQSGVAFDTQRNRLLVSAQRFLYGYDPAADKWSIVRELDRGMMLQALTYSEAEDCLYGLRSNMGGRAGLTVCRFDANGQPAGEFTVKVELPEDPMINLRSPPQLLVVGKQLAVVLPPRLARDEMMQRAMARVPQPGGPAPRQPQQRPVPPGTCALIDPATAEVTYSGEMLMLPKEAARPQQAADAAELAKLWDALAKAPPADADTAAATLAAGGDGAVAAIRLKMPPAPAAPDAEALKALVARLDGDDWKQREAAAAELASAGGAAEPQLREALANAKSEEARQRLDAVLKQLQTLRDPATSAEALEKAAGDSPVRARLRAVRALSHVRTPAAARLLREIAGAAPGSVDAVQARRALAGM
jgi:hypothetical protein